MRYLSLLTMAVAVFVASSAQAIPEESASERCRVFFQLIERFIPQNISRNLETIDRIGPAREQASVLLKQLSDFLRAEANARKVQPKLSVDDSTHTTPHRELADGLVWRYRSGERERSRTSDGDDVLQKRLERILSQFATPESAEKVTVAFESSRANIEGVLETKHFHAGYHFTPTRRVVTGTIVGGLLGAVGTLVRSVIQHEVSGNSYEAAFNDATKEASSSNREVHLRRLRTLRDPRFPDDVLTDEAIDAKKVQIAVASRRLETYRKSRPQKVEEAEFERQESEILRLSREEKKLERELELMKKERDKLDAILTHARWLDQQARLGQKLDFGSVPEEYAALLERTTFHQSEMEDLARAPVLTRQSYFSSKDSKRNLPPTRDFEKTNGEKANLFEMLLTNASWLAPTGLLTGFTLTAKWPQIKARLLGPPESNAPELQELRATATSANPHSAVDWVWLGANTNEGRHTDVILKIDRGRKPPELTLLGLEYQTPVDYLTDQERTPTRDSNGRLLVKLRETLIADHFGRTFGDDLRPLHEAFALAARMDLTDFEMKKFQAEVAKVKDKASLPRLLGFLRGLR